MQSQSLAVEDAEIDSYEDQVGVKDDWDDAWIRATLACEVKATHYSELSEQKGDSSRDWDQNPPVAQDQLLILIL